MMYVLNMLKALHFLCKVTAACRSVLAIVAADVSTSDAVAFSHDDGAVPTAADILRENKREAANDIVHL